jgi:hypothetical protein
MTLLTQDWQGKAWFAAAFATTLGHVEPSTAPPHAAPATTVAKRQRNATQTRRGKVDHLTLTVVHLGNPYRRATKAHATFEHFRAYNGAKVHQVKAAASAEHDLGYLNYSSRDGYITLT